MISCHREEGLAKLDTRAKLNQQTPTGQRMRPGWGREWWWLGGGEDNRTGTRPTNQVHLSQALGGKVWNSGNSKGPWRCSPHL